MALPNPTKLIIITKQYAAKEFGTCPLLQCNGSQCNTTERPNN